MQKLFCLALVISLIQHLQKKKRKKEKKRKRCTGFIYLAIVIVYRDVLPDENGNNQKIVVLHKYHSFLVNCLPIELPF